LSAKTEAADRIASEAKSAPVAWERLFLRLAETAHEGICTVDRDGTIAFVSDRLAKMVGRAASELLGLPFSELVDRDPHGLVPPATREGRAALLRRADGSRFWASLATVRDDGGGAATTDVLQVITDLSPRMEAEERFRISEARHRALFEANPSPMWIHDVETLRFLDVNDAAVACYGYSRDEFLGMTLRDIRLPEEAQALPRAVLAATAGLDLRGTCRHRRKDGSTVHVEMTSHTVEFGGHRAECVLADDATARMRSESILHSLAAATARTTGDEFLKFTVRHLASLLGVRWALVGALDHEDTGKVETLAYSADGEIAPNFRYALAGTPCDNLAGRALCYFGKDVRKSFPGDPLLAHLHAESYLGLPLTGANGEPVGVLVVLHDRPMEHTGAAASILTIFADRVAAELLRMRSAEALAQSEATQRMLIGALPDLILRLSRDGTYLDVHTPAHGEIQNAASRWVGKRIPDVLPAPIAERALLCLKNAFESPEVQTLEYRLPVRGEDRDWEARLTRGGPDVVLAIVRDVTNQKRLDERVRHAQKLEGLEVLAGGIAHDFNNLLAGIMGFASLAQAHVGAESPLHPYLRNIEIAAQRGAELTRQMLAYSGKGRFVTEEIQINRLVEEMLHLLQTVISKNAALQLDFSLRLPCILGDATQIRQLIMNLITNASDAIGTRPGKISVSTGTRCASREELQNGFLDVAASGGEFVFLEVVDDGCGMEPRTLERLFDPFFTTKFTGRGLGLAAARGIVRAHGGAILVESEPGRGSKFTVLFPSLGRQTTTAQSAPPRAVADVETWRGSGTILVVDDEEHIREVLEVTLEEHGFRVLTASDGEEGVRAFRRHAREIRAVLLDMTMPHQGGAETLRQLRAVDPEVSVVLMSGYSEQEIRQHFEGRDLAGFLQKPYQSAELLGVLQAVLADEPAK